MERKGNFLGGGNIDKCNFNKRELEEVDEARSPLALDNEQFTMEENIWNLHQQMNTERFLYKKV